MPPARIQFPYPLLLSDIGGTNCRFALVADKGAPLQRLGSIATAGVPDFAGAVGAVCRQAGMQPASLLVCAAGPMRGRGVQLTNAAWTIDGPALAQALGLRQGLLLNDFEALALALPSLQPGWTRAIGGGDADTARPALVLGPGTGLGMACLAEADGRHLALASEAGHVDFAPAGEEEEAIWKLVRGARARITPETFLSGVGLARLHAARMAVQARAPYREPVGGDEPALLTRAALADPSSAEADTVRHFWQLVARFAGDCALMLFARGGVTLAGGILPRIDALLDESAFRAAFEAKEPMRDVLTPVPVRLLLRKEAVLHGMAAVAARPQAFAIQYGARLWR